MTRIATRLGRIPAGTRFDQHPQAGAGSGANARVRADYVTEREPIVELQAFSSPGAIQTPWARGREEFARAQLYWLTTVRPDGRHMSLL